MASHARRLDWDDYGGGLASLASDLLKLGTHRFAPQPICLDRGEATAACETRSRHQSDEVDTAGEGNRASMTDVWSSVQTGVRGAGSDGCHCHRGLVVVL